MGTFRIAAVLILLVALAPTGRAEVPDAGQLVWTVKAALSGAAQAAKDPGSGLDLKNPKQALFWRALQGFQGRVDRIGGSLAGGREELFRLIDQGSSDLGALRVAWARAGVKNDQVAAGIHTSSTSYRLLRSTYGREGVRQSQGGPLTGAEKRQLQRLQRAERRFAENARLLRDQARRRGDAAAAAELERFRAEAHGIALAAANLATYLNARIAASELRGEWHADVPYIRKAASPGAWAAADQAVEDLYVDADVGQVFTVDLDAPAGGAASGGGAVQVYQASGEPAEAVVEPITGSGDEMSEPAGPAADPEEATAADITVVEPVAESGAPPAGAPWAAPEAAKDKVEKDSKPAVPPPVPPPIG